MDVLASTNNASTAKAHPHVLSLTAKGVSSMHTPQLGATTTFGAARARVETRLGTVGIVGRVLQVGKHMPMYLCCRCALRAATRHKCRI